MLHVWAMVGAGVTGVVGAALSWARIRRERRVLALAGSLARSGLVDGPADGPADRFDPSMLEDLPEPARRYLRRAIAPGTPMYGSIRLTLTGAIRLSRNGAPAVMRSEEVLSPPRGFVWTARVRQGLLSIRGYDLFVDGRGEMRWWLAGIFPIVRGSGADFDRSAIGRMLGESVLLPPALLPSRGARWEPLDRDRARVFLRSGTEEVQMDLSVGSDGRLERAVVRRWNGDATNGPVGYLPFVMEAVGAERTFDGLTLPGRFQAGWAREGGTTEPFFFAEVERATPGGPPQPARAGRPVTSR